jgi:hypothetical protein
MNDENKNTGKTVTEEIEGIGNQVVDRVQDLLRQGNVRRLIVKSADDKIIIDTTLTLGAVAGGLIGLMTGPIGLIIAALGATIARLKIEVIREITDTDIQQGGSKSKVEIKDE